jgi:hypothetical protein
MHFDYRIRFLPFASNYSMPWGFSPIMFTQSLCCHYYFILPAFFAPPVLLVLSLFSLDAFVGPPSRGSLGRLISWFAGLTSSGLLSCITGQ